MADVAQEEPEEVAWPWGARTSDGVFRPPRPCFLQNLVMYAGEESIEESGVS